jgi:hypothetical protein
MSNNINLKDLIKEEIAKVLAEQSKAKSGKSANYKTSKMKESVESAFEDGFALDNSKGGTDNSLNKIHRQLLKLQTQMNELMLQWKNGKMDTKAYVAKRKPLQDLRNKLEASLLGV